MELFFNVEKCGLMLFDDLTVEKVAGEYVNGIVSAHEYYSDKTIWHIHDKAIPVVDQYTYLGLDFDANVRLSTMVDARSVKGKKALYHFEPLFRSPTIPFTAKRLILNSIVLSTMLYGSELTGMKIERYRKQQLLLHTAMRWILNFKGPISMLVLGSAHEELGVLPIKTLVAARRIRGYLKFPELNTWIGEFCKHPLRVRRVSWFTNTEKWMNRYMKPFQGVGPFRDMTQPAFGTNKSEAVHWAKKQINRMAIRQWSQCVHYRQYAAASYETFLSLPRWFPTYGNGILLVMLVRCHGYPVQHRVDTCCPGALGRIICSGCLQCGARVPEDYVHMMLVCPRWRGLRERHLGDMVQRATQLAAEVHPIIHRGEVLRDVRDFPALERIRNLEVLQLLLGGKIEGRGLVGWGVHVEPEVEGMPTFEDVIHPHWETADCYRVAGFLHNMHRRRRLVGRIEGGEIVGPGSPLPQEGGETPDRNEEEQSQEREEETPNVIANRQGPYEYD